MENEKKDNVKKQKKKFHMPSAYVVVFIALIIIVLLTYFIPVSVRDPESGDVIYNAMFDENGQVVENAGPQPKGIWDVLDAPVEGFQLASDVGIAILMAGGFLKIMSVTGAMEAGIGSLLKRFKGNALIIVMNLAFALMGTVFGFWEEILPFSLFVIPMFVIAGYDVMMGMAVLFVGATVGNMASIVNPFSTGAAIAAIGDSTLTMGSGIILRAVIFIVLYLISTYMLIRYGKRLKKDPANSALTGIEGVKTNVDENQELPKMTRRRLISGILFILMIVVLVIGYIPWESLGGEGLSNGVNSIFTFLARIPILGDILGAGNVTPFGDWGFNEFSILFFGGALLLMIINKIKMNDFINSFIDGTKDLLGVVFVLAIAKGISVVMGSASAGMSVTLVYWISNALAQTPLWVFAIFAVLAYVGIGFALQSTSGVAGLSMPILGAVAAGLFASSAIGAVGGEVILISAFTLGLNFMTAIYPGAVNLGVAQMYGVPYDSYLKFILKYTIPLLIVGTIVLTVFPYLALAVN